MPPQDLPREPPVDPALATAANRYVEYMDAKERRRKVGNVVGIIWAIVVIVVIVFVTTVMSDHGPTPDPLGHTCAPGQTFPC
jgi:hypothetical protein